MKENNRQDVRYSTTVTRGEGSTKYSPITLPGGPLIAHI
jgi:hypothetical protein